MDTVRPTLRFGGLCLLALLWLAQQAPPAASQGDSPQARPHPSVAAVYQAEVQPLLQKYCYRCHGDTKPKGDVRLDKLSVDFVKGPASDLETWHDVLQNLHRGEMPPRGQPRPTAREHGVLVDFFNRAFVEAREQRESTAGRTVMRRMTSYEFQNTLEDLLGLKLHFTRDLLPEVPSRDGFLNNGSFLTVSSQHVRDFWATARFAMSQAIVTGPAPKAYRVQSNHFVSFGRAGKGTRKLETAKSSSTDYSHALVPDTALMLPLADIPSSGKYRLRITLRATGPRTCLLAWFKVSRNNQTSLIFAKPEVRPSPDDQVVEITGSIEDISVLAQRGNRPDGPMPMLCLSNVGNIHFFLGGNGSKFPGGVDPERARKILEDPQERPGDRGARHQSRGV